MRIKLLCTRIIALVMIAVVMLGLNSCFGPNGKPVKVTVIDNGKTVKADGKDDMTVRQILEQVKINISDKDIVSPKADVVWKDTTADQIVVQRYARVIVVLDNQQVPVELYGATVAQAIAKAGFDVVKYQCEYKSTDYITDGMVINLKEVESGLVTKGDKQYYFQNGEMVTNAVVKDDEGGDIYISPEGIYDQGYCDGVKIDDNQWTVINGKARKVDPDNDYDMTLYRATQAVAKCTDSSMSKEEKIKAGFDYIRTNYLEGVLHDPPYLESDWYVVVANDIFVYGKGDCYSYGAAFAFMLKGMGCDEVYACTTGGHGWSEAEGLVYDPEWSMHSNNYPYFAMTYEEECDVDYSAALDGTDWKHVKLD